MSESPVVSPQPSRKRPIKDELSPSAVQFLSKISKKLSVGRSMARSPPPATSLMPIEAHLPPNAFDEFIEKLSYAPELARVISRLIETFQDETTCPLLKEDQSKLCQDFMKKFTLMMRNHPCFCMAVQRADEGDQHQLLIYQNAVENYIHRRIYMRTFTPNDDWSANDRLLFDRIGMFRFVTLKHLEVDAKYPLELIEQAKEILMQINIGKTPLDKLQSILECCRVIYRMLQTNGDHLRGADSFLPLLVYVLLKANIPCLYSNQKYIELFRSEDLLIGESQCYFVMFSSAISFIENLDASCLCMDPDDFRRAVESNANLQVIECCFDTEWHDLQPIQRTSLIGQDDGWLLLDDKQNSSRIITDKDIFRKNPAQLKLLDQLNQKSFRYMNCKAEDLELDDVRELLEEYRRIVRWSVNLIENDFPNANNSQSININSSPKPSNNQNSK